MIGKRFEKKLKNRDYYDKVLGGWTGKCAGGVLGAPIEGFKRFNRIKLSKDLFNTNFPNDDLDLQVLWLDMVKKKGPVVRETDFAEHWKNHVLFPWNEYGVAKRNLELGLYPPDSGSHNNDYWKESMGSPIRCEIWGMLCPGMPEQAAFYAGMDSSLDHGGFSVDAERFLAAMVASAFFENNIETIYRSCMDVLDRQSVFYQLALYVLDRVEKCEFSVAAGKIKSYWGDADCTSAPQNIGLALAALLRSHGQFDAIMQALHLGHDSDCITALVGSILGVINGYKNLDGEWKEMVGDALSVSPEITGIEYSKTISGLARETCSAGVPFITFFNEIQLEGGFTGAGLKQTQAAYHLNVRLENSGMKNPAGWNVLTVNFEPFENHNTQIELVFSSAALEFKKKEIHVDVAAGQNQAIANRYRLTPALLKKAAAGYGNRFPAAFDYSIELRQNGKRTGTVKRGVPWYGTWMVFGPFIRDNPALEPMDEKYPDHGLASLPSCRYMNHDRINTDTDFLTVEDARHIVKAQNQDEQPFFIGRIFPSSYRINLDDLFYGRGERTFYLYTRLYSDVNRKIWIAAGCTAFFKLWVNSALLYERRQIRRAWPHDAAVEADLVQGLNDLFVKIDMPLDRVDFEIGFKNHTGKHAHQCMWDTQLVPFI